MTGSEDYKGPLVGLNVVDFGHYFAGPMAAMLLADQGANVVHIQRPGAPELKEQQYRSLNRNKKILTLDLKSDEGLAQAKALIAKADVVVENFRPGVMKRLGLDYASLKPLNPGLIYLSLPGFASTDKENAHIQAWEGVMSAAMGLYTMTSEVRRPNNFPPLYTWTPICSGYGAMNGAGAVMAALIARREHGVGTMIEVPLVDAGMTAFEADFLMKGGGAVPLRKYPTPSSAGRKKRENPNAYEPGDSIEVQKEKLSRATKRRLFQTYGFIIFKCGDGRGLMLSSKSWKVLEILGIKDEVKKRGFVVESPWEIGLGNNAHGYLTDERKAELLGLIEDALKAKPAEEWEKLIQDAGGHASVVRTRDEWLSLAPHAESGMVNTLEDKETTLYVPGRLSGISGPGDTPISRKLYDAVEISFSDAEELFSGYEVPTGTPPKTPLRKGDLLKGLKVLDMSNVVAGPSISVHLAEYGAEIIRSDPPIPTHYSPGIHPMVLLMNQGKRSIVSDMTTAPGREIFRKLVNWADIVTHNCVDGTAERLGVSHKQLREINPEIVTCQLSGQGGPYRGGWGNRRGAEQDVQASTGLMALYGTLDEPQRHSIIGLGDVPAGFGGIFTALLGVYQKRTNGYGSECRTSLAHVSNYVQFPYMIMENGKADWGEAHGQFAVGPTWYQRIYQCNDGWIFVGAHESRASELAELVTGDAGADEAAMEIALHGESCAHWTALLQKASIGCHRVETVEDILKGLGVKHVDNEPAHETAHAGAEILSWDNHPCGYQVIMPAPDYVRIGEDHSWFRLKPAPRIGGHTREVLAELGYSEEQIEELIRYRVAHEYFPPMGSTEAHLFPIKKAG